MPQQCEVSIFKCEVEPCCIDLQGLITACEVLGSRLLLKKTVDFSSFPSGANVIRSVIVSGSWAHGSPPQIVRPNLILGSRIAVRSICLEDAGFVVSLRLNSGRGKFLSDIDGSIDAQRDWLRGYLKDPNQAYFVIYDIKNLSPVGLVRMYGARGDCFSWGSWIFLPGVDSFLAFEFAMLIYQYAFLLGFESSYFDVRSANISVRRFHEKLGAVPVGSDDHDVFYKFYGSGIRAAFAKYRRFSPSRLKICFGCES